MIDTTNARVRPIITTRGHCPTDEAGTSWHFAMQPFARLFEDRFTNPASSKEPAHSRFHAEHENNRPHTEFLTLPNPYPSSSPVIRVLKMIGVIRDPF